MIRKFFTFFLILGSLSLAAFGQSSLPHADISVEVTSPVNNAVIPYRDTAYVSFNYTNNGPDTIPAGDTLFFDVSGNLIYSLLFDDMLPGNTFVYTDIMYLWNPTDDSLSGDVCVAHIRQEDIQYTNGSSPETTYIDEDTTNDINCVHVLFLGPDSDSTNGIVEASGMHSGPINIYPNPASAFLTFDFSGQPGERNLSIKVKDMTGRTVLHVTKAISSGKASYRINIQKLQPAVYFLDVTTKKRRMESKFIISR